MEYEKERGVIARPGAADSNAAIDQLIEETEEAIRNTRSFLDHLRSSEENARELVGSMKQRLEKDLQILQRRSEARSST